MVKISNLYFRRVNENHVFLLSCGQTWSGNVQKSYKITVFIRKNAEEMIKILTFWFGVAY